MIQRFPTLVTLIYCLRQGKVLLARRVNEPYVGFWLAPGGKIKPGESPRAGACRELLEETGLVAGPDLRLKAVVSETSPREDHQWLLFIYRTSQTTGEVCSDQREGPLQWHGLDQLSQLRLPEPDRVFTPHVLGDGQEVYEAHFELDEQLRIVKQTVS